jgi:hypothetical protein
MTSCYPTTRIFCTRLALPELTRLRAARAGQAPPLPGDAAIRAGMLQVRCRSKSLKKEIARRFLERPGCSSKSGPGKNSRRPRGGASRSGTSSGPNLQAQLAPHEAATPELALRCRSCSRPSFSCRTFACRSCPSPETSGVRGGPSRAHLGRKLQLGLLGCR